MIDRKQFTDALRAAKAKTAALPEARRAVLETNFRRAQQQAWFDTTYRRPS